MSAPVRYEAAGPFRADDLRPGGRYELHDGHPIYCPPAGSDTARARSRVAALLDTDPGVEEAGLGPGYAPTPRMLRAPDLAVGNVPEKRGWLGGAPQLAVQFAAAGQDEDDLQDKIADFLAAGTKLVWVVRLLDPRRIEVHEPGKPIVTLGSGDTLSAPGILRNTYPVEAFYDRPTAHRLTLRNLLQREGREEGLRTARAEALWITLEARGLPVTEADRERVFGCRDAQRLLDWFRRALRADQLADVFG